MGLPLETHVFSSIDICVLKATGFDAGLVISRKARNRYFFITTLSILHYLVSISPSFSMMATGALHTL